jgi:hypothetical protein
MVTATAAPRDAPVDDPSAHTERDRALLALRATAGLVWIGLYGMYVRLWVLPSDLRGDLERWARPVAEGTAAAPFQYRFAVPDLLVWCADHLGWRIGFTHQLVDAIALAIGVVLLDRLLRHLDLGLWLLPASLYAGFLGLGIVWWGKFETTTAFAATTLATAALLGAVPRRGLALGVAAALLVGTRTDLLIAVGVAELARWWWVDRRPAALRSGLLLAGTGVAATVGLKAIYPDAAYDASTGVVQVWHNLQPTNLAIAIAFLAPALVPLALAWRGPQVRAALADQRTVLVPAIALVAAEVGSVLLIGRADEVRLFFPLVAALSVIGIVGWSAVLRVLTPR